MERASGMSKRSTHSALPNPRRSPSPNNRFLDFYLHPPIFFTKRAVESVFCSGSHDSTALLRRQQAPILNTLFPILCSNAVNTCFKENPLCPTLIHPITKIHCSPHGRNSQVIAPPAHRAKSAMTCECKRRAKIHWSSICCSNNGSAC